MADEKMETVEKDLTEEGVEVTEAAREVYRESVGRYDESDSELLDLPDVPAETAMDQDIPVEKENIETAEAVSSQEVVTPPVDREPEMTVQASSSKEPAAKTTKSKKKKGRETKAVESKVTEGVRIPASEARKAATQAIPIPKASVPTRDDDEEGSPTACCFKRMGMKPKCLEGSRSTSSSYALLENIGKGSSTEKQELTFFNESGGSTNFEVEKNLRAVDLCFLLAMQNRLTKDFGWSIVEYWTEIGLERVLEDHENVLAVNSQTERGGRKFFIRRNTTKYDFFIAPQVFFLSTMTYVKEWREILILTDELVSSFDCPITFSQVCLQKPNKKDWVKTYLLMRNRKLFVSSKVNELAKYMRNCKHRKSSYRSLNEQDQEEIRDAEKAGLRILADLNEYELYSCLNSKNHLKAPTEYGVCLRRTSEENFKSAIVFSCETNNDRTCWMLAMRLAKFGKKLKANYREFLDKRESASTEETSRLGSSSESVVSRVAMDFTGSVGRIVEDPDEARAIAIADASSTGGKHRLRPRTTAAMASAAAAAALVSGWANCSTDFQPIDMKHVNRPWFHKDMTREHASRALLRFSNEDGTFIIRESRSHNGCYVLSFKMTERVLHMRIYPMIDSVTLEPCFSLDNGDTKFYNLVKLVEFYRLNEGSLPIRLTRYLERATSRSTDV